MADPDISIRTKNAPLTERNKFNGSIPEGVAWLKRQADVSDLVVSIYAPTEYITVSDFLSKYVVSGIVPKFYMMDPNTEDLLPSGKHLKNGMKVLIADSAQRGKAKEMDQSWMRERVVRENRWCTVTELQVINNLTTFIGVYDDGVKFKRSNSTMDPWLVKLGSVTKVKIEESERYNKVRAHVYEAIRDVMVGETDGDAFELDPEVERIIENATKAILGTLG